jgi:methionine-rich copper-binding protein CopC
VKAPPGTPADATLYVPGNIDQLGPWDPGKLAMTSKGDNIYEATVTILDSTDVQYKYTRGSWDTVENWGTIVGTVNRDVVIDGGISHTMLVDDTATSWDDPAVPDSHKAIQYWRDPLVVSTTPADGSTGAAPSAVVVTFETGITANDLPGTVVVQGPGGAVAGTVAHTSAAVLTWTPAAALPSGSYQVTVDGVSSDLGGGSVPIQRPYVFAFTVG